MERGDVAHTHTHTHTQTHTCTHTHTHALTWVEHFRVDWTNLPPSQSPPRVCAALPQHTNKQTHTFIYKASLSHTHTHRQTHTHIFIYKASPSLTLSLSLSHTHTHKYRHASSPEIGRTHLCTPH